MQGDLVSGVSMSPSDTPMAEATLNHENSKYGAGLCRKNHSFGLN